MPEAITKYAVNSTLGTSDFESLDVQIAEQQTLYASNEIYAKIGQNINISLDNSVRDKTVQVPYKIKMRSTGNFNISTPLSWGNSNRVSQYVVMNVYKNEELFLTKTEKITTGQSAPEKLYFENIAFSKGDVFSFSVRYYDTLDTNATVTFYPVQILGTIKQNVMKILEV